MSGLMQTEFYMANIEIKYLRDKRDGFIWVYSDALARKPYMELFSKRTVSVPDPEPVQKPKPKPKKTRARSKKKMTRAKSS